MARDGVDTRQAGPSRVLMRVPARLTRVLATDGSGPETVLALCGQWIQSPSANTSSLIRHSHVVTVCNSKDVTRSLDSCFDLLVPVSYSFQR